jgi:aryl-alcohol dehydrogenase-like predicted oxidoreductase
VTSLIWFQVKAGYVRYIGASSMHAWQFSVMQNYAINNKLTPFISMQNLFTAVYREEEREMIPLCKHYGVGIIPWSPLARGYLTRPASEQKSTARGESDKLIASMEYGGSREINEVIEKLAKEKGKSMAQIALAYCLAKPDICVRSFDFPEKA